MTKYTAVVMTKFPTINGDRISDDLMNDIVEHQPSVPVTADFNHIYVGKTVEFRKTEKGVECDIELEASEKPLKKLTELIERKFLVPIFDDVAWHYEGKLKVIDLGVLDFMIITFFPADTNLKPLYLKGDKKDE